MSAALHPNLRNKLAKVCRRMDNENDAERAAAALLATRILASVNLSWRDVIAGLSNPAFGLVKRSMAAGTPAKSRRGKAVPSRRAYRHPDEERRIARFQSEIRFVREHLHMLTEAEQQDLERRCTGPRAWSARRPKQLDCTHLSALAEMVRQRLEETA